MTQINYPNDITGSIQIVHGSDGRLNTSSRSDGRAYYNSRDLGQFYAVPFQDADADAAEFVVYWQNTDTTKTLVINHVGISSTIAGTFILHKMDGVAGTGTDIVPINLNFASPNAASANAKKGTGGVGVGGAGTDGIIDVIQVGAGDHGEFDVADTLRLGQNQAIAVEYDRGASSIVEGVIYGFYE